MLQKSNFSSLSPRLDWKYKVRDTFWWIVQKTDLVFGQICRNWTLSFWPTDRACSQTSNFPLFTVLWIHKKDTNTKSFATDDEKLKELTLRYWRCWWGRGRVWRALPSWKWEWTFCVMHQRCKKIMWKIANEKAAPFKNETVWFLDQCSCHLGKAFSLFGLLCFDRYWQQNWKLVTLKPTFRLDLF